MSGGVIGKNGAVPNGGHQSAAGVRLAVLEMSRVTEQVAILSSYAAGTSYVESTLRCLACEAFLQCLRYSLCHGARLVHIDPPWLGWTEPKGKKPRFEISQVGRARFDDTWKPYLEEKAAFGGLLNQLVVAKTEIPSTLEKELALDLVISPIDGVKNLLSGEHGGSMSIIAGGPKGETFRGAEDESMSTADYVKQSNKSLAQRTYLKRYFVITIPNADLGKCFADKLHNNEDSDGKAIFEINVDAEKPSNIKDVREIKEFFEGLPDEIAKEQPEELKSVLNPMVATINDETAYGFASLLRGGFRRRKFLGSPTAAALTVLLGKHGFDLFAAVVRETNAFLIATAAKALGASCFAIELEPDAAQKKLVCPVGARVLRELDLVKSEDTFLVLTGITAHPLLRGVRVLAEGKATTHTLAFNARSRTTRLTTHHRDIKSDMFRSLDDAALKRGWLVISEFLSRLPVK